MDNKYLTPKEIEEAFPNIEDNCFGGSWSRNPNYDIKKSHKGFICSILGTLALATALYLAPERTIKQNKREEAKRAETIAYGGYKDRVFYILGDNTNDGLIKFE